MLNDQLLKIRAWILIGICVLLCPIVIFAAVIYTIFKSVWKTRKNIAGEIALITGGSNGLGKEIAKKLAAKGCHIAVVDIDEQAAISTAKLLSETYKVKSKAYKVDVTNHDEIKTLEKKVEEQLGPVTILVNNAGMLLFSRSADPPPSEIQKMINTNILAHIWTVRTFLDKMRKLKKGHIVAIASVAGVIPCPRQLEYTTTKFGVHGFMAALRTELYALECEFIKTTTVLPYFLQTNSNVVDLISKAGINSIYPNVTGPEAAEATVEGLLTNETEVFIPKMFTLYRLLEVLPKDWQTKILNSIVGRNALTKIEY